MNSGARLIAGRYRLEQRVGTGAMGVVWRAHDERLERTVAVKELLVPLGLAGDAHAARDRAMREGRIAARLKHPHAIHVYDVALDAATGTSDQVVPWLVMEYLPARSLAEVLAERGTLAPGEAAGIGQQVAAALAAAHDAGIVHRDVKPGNVLLGQNGVAKITDFGISRASWDATVTRTGVLAGTPAYFAPEVARGELPGPASDVFSLGSMLYVAVEGEPPFGLEDNTLALLRTVAEGRVRPPRRAGQLSTVLMRLLAEDPAERPSMPEAVRDLAAVATQTAPPASAAPTMAMWRGQPSSWLRPAMLVGTFGCLVVLAIVLSVGSNTAVPTAGHSPVAVPRTPPVSGAGTPPAPARVPARPLEPAQLAQTVRTYYNLLPQDTTVAWQYLGAAERNQGFQRYNDFWSEINRISIRGPVAVRGNTVLVNLVFEPTNRKRTFERYRLSLSNASDGRILIDSATRIGQH